MTWLSVSRWLLALVLGQGLCACGPKTSSDAHSHAARGSSTSAHAEGSNQALENRKPSDKSKTVSAELVGYNHTDKTIASFAVNGEWGGNITPHSGGGSFVCCVRLPDPWTQGYSVTLEWEDDKGQPHKKQIPVPKYDAKTLADLNVHFLRGGGIKVYALRMTLGHPDYPLKGQESELKPGVPIEIVR